MDEDTKRVLETLDRLGQRNTHGAFEPAEELFELVERAVREPCNSAGTDKGCVERGYRELLEYYRRVWEQNP